MAMDVPPEDRALVDADYASHADRIAAIIPHYFRRVWNDRQLELTELMWDPEIVFHSPIKPEPVVGRAELMQYVGQIITAFPDLRFDIDDTIAQGDRAVLRVTQTGTQTGEYFGIPPTGRPVRMSEVFVFRAPPVGPLGARIEEIWLYLNALELMQQLKLFPSGNPPRPLLRAVIGAQRLARRNGGAPGPRGIAYVPKFGRDPETFFADLRRRYGDVVRVERGPLAGYLVFHPREIKHVLVDNAENYGHGDWFAEKLGAALGRSVFTVDHAEWKRHRAILAPLFGDELREHVVAIAAVETDAVAARWAALARTGAVVDMRAEMEELDRTVAGRTIFGDEDWAAGKDVLGEVRGLFIEQAGRVLNSPLGFVPLSVPTPFHRRFLQARDEYDRLVASLIERRRSSGARGGLLDALAAAPDVDERHVRDAATTIFFLWEPVPITLTHVWDLLARNPRVAKKLRDGDGAYLDAVIDETLRLYPPIYLLPREALADDELGGYRVAAGTRVLITPYATNRHSELWDDPDEFRPERFEEQTAREAFALFRFGEPAPRECLGYHLALAELKVILASLAMRFAPALVSDAAPPKRFTVASDVPTLPMRIVAT